MPRKKKHLLFIIYILSFKYFVSQNKFYEERFSENTLKWETGLIENSESYIENNCYIIKSNNENGTIRLIKSPYGTDVCNISCEINNALVGTKNKVGVIFGFESWRDYNYFVFDKKYVYIGNVSDNITQKYAHGIYVDKIINGKNSLQILYEDVKAFFYINGVKVFETRITKNKGDKLGFIIPNKDALKVSYFKLSETSNKTQEEQISSSNKTVKSFGCGLLFSKDGYVLSCNTNLDLGKEFLVDIKNKTYAAKKVFVNDILDLALIKLEDFDGFHQRLPLLATNSILLNDSLYLYYYSEGLGNKKLSVDTIFTNTFNLNVGIEVSVFQLSNKPILSNIAGALLLNNKKQVVGITRKNEQPHNLKTYKNSDLFAFLEGSGIDFNLQDYTATTEINNVAIEDFLVFIRAK
jgi:hypothetical protein